MEAAGLAVFMISACAFATLLEHPSSPVRQAIANPLLRRVPMGLAMGLTAVGIISSPWGQQSGAHLNPAVTLSFLRLGKIAPGDALGYVAGQFAGGVAGTAVAALLLGVLVRHPAVNFAATVPGSRGVAVAFAGEVLITFLLMSVVLRVSNTAGLARFTPYFAGALVAAFITFEAPLSGMSMNPARTLGSAVFAQTFNALWIYFTAPVAGMLIAAELYVRQHGLHRVFCAKLHHHNRRRCIFRCDFTSLEKPNHKPTQPLEVVHGR